MEGIQTKDFRDRLHRNIAALPPLVIQLAMVLERMIEEIETPTRADIARLHGAMRDILGSKETLIGTCGNEGNVCAMCPFMAYVPTDIQFACEERPICLPWIALQREPDSSPVH